MELPSADPPPLFGRTATSAVDLVLGAGLAAAGLGLLAWVVAVADALMGGEWGLLWAALAAAGGVVLLLAGVALAGLAQVALGDGDPKARDRLASLLLAPLALLVTAWALVVVRRPGLDVLLAHLVPAAFLALTAVHLWRRDHRRTVEPDPRPRRADDISTQ